MKLNNLIVLLMMMSLSCETLEENYVTKKDAVSDGAMKRGWIPRWIPASSREIKEVHNLDTNWTLMTFEFDTKEKWGAENATFGEHLVEK